MVRAKLEARPVCTKTDTGGVVAPPRVMGVLNVTPDSFSDGGKHFQTQGAVTRGLEMAAQGAEIIDIGGESSRPGAQSVSVQCELDRVIPVIERLADEVDVLLSIDTCKPTVMREAVNAGARFINDINALREDGALRAAAELQVPVCLMHMQGKPRDMQRAPSYTDVVREVSQFLIDRAQQCIDGGIAAQRIILDPGLGFGKTLQHNLRLLANLNAITAAGFDVLIGISRKQTIGTVLGRDVDDRLHGSVGLAVQAVLNGARIVRVHDVGPTVDALRMVQAVREAYQPWANESHGRESIGVQP